MKQIPGTPDPARKDGQRPARPPSPARLAAWETLRHAWNPRGPGISDVLESQAGALKLDSRDLGLAREIVYGVLRRRALLDKALERHLSEPLARLPPEVHDVLLMGSYQLLFLDRVPPHAAVAESVELLAASVSTQRYRGLANAVLRKVAAEGRASLANAEWQVRESMPQVVLEALSGSLPPEEWEAFAVASNSQAPLCIRVTRLGKESPEFRKRLANRQLRAAGEEVTLRSSSLAGEDCWLIEHGGFIPSQVAGFAEGWFTIEDEGAQVAALLAGAGQSGPLLDLCASPGGKTSHLADLIPTAERILATDLNDAKLERLRETLTRLGLTSRVETMLSRKVLGGGFAKAFGTVLVDAPCSGLGTLRRHPEIRYRFGKHGRSQVVQNQEQLLRDASRVVRPDGVLVYTVCTVNRAECEDQVQHFLATTPDFAPDSVGKKGLPFNPERLSCGPGMWRTWPHRHGCDGFFVARLRRKAD